MRIGIIQFPGSNCERETGLALQRVGLQPVYFLWNEPLSRLAECQGFVLIGGFSYEDRSRAGIIAALDPIMTFLSEQADEGKPILGICNGAQILVESGLVPGVENRKVVLALTGNKRMIDSQVIGTGYYNTWVHLKLRHNYQRNAFTRHLSINDKIHVPIAHAQGRFVMSEALLMEMRMQGLGIFQYCDAKGDVSPDFPNNPNGSIDNLAAISNKRGNVLAMMPHPERTVAGDPIFASMRDYIAEGRVAPVVQPLNYYPRRKATLKYQPARHALTWIIESILTDNTAISVESTLQRMGYAVSVKRYLHWEMSCADVDRAACQNTLAQTGIIYNDNNARLVSKDSLADSRRAEVSYVLVRPKEDLLAAAKLQQLQHHCHISGLERLRSGILWQLTAKEGNICAILPNLLNSHLLQNPYSHDSYQYESF